MGWAARANPQKRTGTTAPRGRIVVVRHEPSGTFVPNVDPVTHAATADPQQFELLQDGHLRILPRREWIADPEQYPVQKMRYA